MNPLSAHAADKISVAVAANFISAFKDLADDFETKTKIKIEGTFSSTGNLYTQIINGAPYDIFLSADEDRPARLYKDGASEKPFVYASGHVILWSANKGFCKAAGWQEALENNKSKKIAIANPLTAPYGAAAKEALQKTHLWEASQSRLVNAQDIAQSFQYASTAAVEAGFCALSVTATPQGRNGCFFNIIQAPDVIQSACVLKRASHRDDVEKFAAYLVSPAARKIKMKYGYR